MVILVKPDKCPGCGESMPLAAYGTPSVYLIEDAEIPAKWFCLIGWECGTRHRVIFGTVFRDGLTGFYGIPSTGHTYVVNMPGRTVTVLPINDIPIQMEE